MTTKTKTTTTKAPKITEFRGFVTEFQGIELKGVQLHQFAHLNHTDFWRAVKLAARVNGR